MVLISNRPGILQVHQMKGVKVRRRCLGGYLLNSNPAVIPLEVLSEMVLFEGLQTLQMFIRSVTILKKQSPPIPLTYHWKTYMRESLVITSRLSLMAHQGLKDPHLKELQFTGLILDNHLMNKFLEVTALHLTVPLILE